jgi:hypothetical protein
VDAAVGDEQGGSEHPFADEHRTPMTGAVAAGPEPPCTAVTKGIGYSVGEPAGLDTATVAVVVAVVAVVVVVAAAAVAEEAAVVEDVAVQGLVNVVVVRAEKKERGSNSFWQSRFLVLTLISD